VFRLGVIVYLRLFTRDLVYVGSGMHLLGLKMASISVGLFHLPSVDSLEYAVIPDDFVANIFRDSCGTRLQLPLSFTSLKAASNERSLPDLYISMARLVEIFDDDSYTGMCGPQA
jgi:hypothetical protein